MVKQTNNQLKRKLVNWKTVLRKSFRIKHNKYKAPSLLDLAPRHQFRPARSPQGAELRSLCYAAGSHLSALHVAVYTCQSQSPSASRVHATTSTMSILYICISIPALEPGSSAPFFQIPHVSINTKAKINKWDLMKLQGFCTARKTINEMKRQPSEREKLFANDAAQCQTIQNETKVCLYWQRGPLQK